MALYLVLTKLRSLTQQSCQASTHVVALRGTKSMAEGLHATGGRSIAFGGGADNCDGVKKPATLCRLAIIWGRPVPSGPARVPC